MSTELKDFISGLFEEIGLAFGSVDVDIPEDENSPGYKFVVGVIDSVKEAIGSLDIDDSGDLSNWWSDRGHEAIEGFSDYADADAALIWIQTRGWEHRLDVHATSDVTDLINRHLGQIAYGIAEAVVDDTISEIEAWEKKNLDGEDDDEEMENGE